MQTDLHFNMALAAMRKIDRKIRVKGRRPIKRVLEPRQEVMVSWIRVVEKMYKFYIYFDNRFNRTSNGLDVESEENGGIKDDA